MKLRSRPSIASALSLPITLTGTDSVKNILLQDNHGKDRVKVYLHPGQLFVSSEPSVVTTILGSCVSLCLWDPETKIGGVNHFLLPYQARDDMASPRFGTVAVQSLIEKTLFQGACRLSLRAKLFGGACVIRALQDRENHIGMQNIRLAEAMLSREEIVVVEKDLAGQRGRKLTFHTDDGTSQIKYL